MKNPISAKSQVRLLVRQNIRLARRWKAGELGPVALERLRNLTKKFGFSLALGDFQYLDGGWYVTHAGLLRLAQRRRCVGIRVQQVRQFCDPLMVAGCSKPPFSINPDQKASSATATPIPPT